MRRVTCIAAPILLANVGDHCFGVFGLDLKRGDERINRERRNVERRIRLARFPQTKSFDTFDFAAQPSLNKGFWT